MPENKYEKGRKKATDARDEKYGEISTTDRVNNTTQALKEDNGDHTGSVNMDHWFTEKFGPVLVQKDVATKDVKERVSTPVNDDFDSVAHVRKMIEDMSERHGWDTSNEDDKDRDID